MSRRGDCGHDDSAESLVQLLDEVRLGRISTQDEAK